LLPEARFDTHLNQGQGRVSPLCHEPRVALAVLYELLAPYLTSGQAEIVLRCKPVHVQATGDRVRAVTVRDQSTGEDEIIHAPYVLDATESVRIGAARARAHSSSQREQQHGSAEHGTH
jgi:hypothetical protein